MTLFTIVAILLIAGSIHLLMRNSLNKPPGTINAKKVVQRLFNKLLLVVCCTALPGCYMIGPKDNFFVTAPPEAPNYALSDAWAALPEKQDLADLYPAGEHDLQKQAAVDVFFVHPTTHFCDTWNQCLSNAEVNKATDKGPIRFQASTFNSVARVYAPRYRQAILYSFLAGERIAEGEAALNLAYKDVAAAFEYYLKHYNQGRPIIIAGHSQGALHSFRLLKDYFTKKPLLKQLVAAYVIGMYFPLSLLKQQLPDIPLANDANQTGCFITWNTVNYGACSGHYRLYQLLTVSQQTFDIQEHPIACVNPLTWSINTKKADTDLHQGIVIFADNVPNPEPDTQIVHTRCSKEGLLKTEVTRLKYWWLILLLGNYHILDYNLFYMNIRRNAEQRVATFLQNQAIAANK